MLDGIWVSCLLRLLRPWPRMQSSMLSMMLKLMLPLLLLLLLLRGLFLFLMPNARAVLELVRLCLHSEFPHMCRAMTLLVKMPLMKALSFAGLALPYRSPTPPPPPKAPTRSMLTDEPVPPPWVVALQTSMQSMHSKQDQVAGSVEQLGRELGVQAKRLDVLRGTVEEHARQHRDSQERIQALEAQVQQSVTLSQLQDIEAQMRDLRDLETRLRELQDQVNHLPVSGPQTPRMNGSPKDIEAELQVVVGGWSEAPRYAAEREVRSLFHECGVYDALADLWAPGQRTNFVRATLRFPSDCKSLPAKSNYQVDILKRLKQDRWTSAVEGSKGSFLWVSRHRTLEERHKIRAILQCKDFYDAIRRKMPEKAIPQPEFDWRGKVFVGRHQMLLAPSPGPSHSPPTAHDLALTDARGGYTGWAVSAARFALVSGLNEADLFAAWQEHGPLSGKDRS